MKRVLMMSFILVIVFTMVACRAGSNDIMSWTNEQAVYAIIKSEFKNEVIKDINNSFKNLNYNEVYIVEKNNNYDNELKLLFILNSNDNREEFKHKLLENESINYITDCYDLPFSTIDNRYIECEKSNIEIGEIISIQVKGSKVSYTKQFSYKGFFVKPHNVEDNVIYSVSDFKNISLKNIEKLENGWLYFELETDNYFDLIKSVDKISRLHNIEKVELDRTDVTLIPPPVWTVSNNEILEIIESNETISIKGLSKGETIIEYDGVSLKIKVN